MSHDEYEEYYIGIDVGTGSARACVVDKNGNIIGLASQSIKTWQPHADHYEQSTTDIWNSICTAVREVVDKSEIPKANIRGLAFDATCSLAVFSTQTDRPVPVSGTAVGDARNVILWLDHRAVDETKTINLTKHQILQYVGGGMSPEMEMPKILWLKKHMNSSTFLDCKFYDLADALTYLATGEEARSYCSVICKQGYLASGTDGEEGWQTDFLTSIGLEDLAQNEFERLGGTDTKNGRFLSAGECVGPLTKEAAADLGLLPGIAVGWIGTVGAKVDLGLDSAVDMKEHVSHRLAVVAGTSTCHLAMSKDELFVNGIWGPYRDVLFPGAYLAEGGQSATGELIRQVVESHPAYREAKEAAEKSGTHIYDFMNDYLQKQAKESQVAHVAQLAKHFFFTMSGAVVGLKSDQSIKNLALHYYGALEFIALQTRQIVDTMNQCGHQISTIFMSGSQTQNSLLVHLIASACNMPVVLPEYIHAAMCHGAAMLAAMAASTSPGKDPKSLWEITDQMSKPGRRVDPTNDAKEQGLLQAKFEVFLDMCSRQREYKELVDNRLSGATEKIIR
ncbi:uncharacterized protein N7506_002398 [Penicillium brevicompactum]|uniref:uncharacterized protein n=1 Tax=Penicillium brevicompactum TaxID=5074 RepID=UPI002541CBC1|nr:uncharacterized protein N7506_002398 [Penicillium brevicompactum]KAJ5349145.1 hypothetical protein N7506_002398 [Penicillium brevicompactum]